MYIPKMGVYLLILGILKLFGGESEVRLIDSSQDCFETVSVWINLYYSSVLFIQNKIDLWKIFFGVAGRKELPLAVCG